MVAAIVLIMKLNLCLKVKTETPHYRCPLAPEPWVMGNLLILQRVFPLGFPQIHLQMEMTLKHK